MRIQSRTDRKKKLYKLIVAYKDIEEARHACSLFSRTIRSTSDDMYYPLLTAIVIPYSKPFVKNKALGILPGCWQKFEKRELQETHDRLLKFRHDNIAHNDLSTVQVLIVPPGAKVDGKESKALGVSWAFSRHKLALETFRLIWDTIEDLRMRLEKAINEEMLVLFGLSKLPAESFVLTFDENL
jgi:hypothetical protein